MSFLYILVEGPRERDRTIETERRKKMEKVEDGKERIYNMAPYWCLHKALERDGEPICPCICHAAKKRFT